MSFEESEIIRIQRRVAKSERRIAKGYVAPPGKETEEHRKERLEKRLAELAKDTKF